MGRPLKITKAHAVITLTATNGTTEVVTTSANLNALGIIRGMPFIPAANIGGLVANTTYWILNVLTDNTFTVSATPIDANPTFATVNLSTTSAQTVAATVAPVSAYFNNPTGPQWPATNANTYSVVGGNTSIIGNQVSANVNIGQTMPGTIVAASNSPTIQGTTTNFVGITAGTILYATSGQLIGEVDVVVDADTLTLTADAAINYTGGYMIGGVETGFIVRQKGKQKYLATGTTSGRTGAVFTVDSTVSPQPVNTIVINSTNASNANVAVQSLSNRNIELFTANSGPIATGNIDFSQAAPAMATFNTAAVANVTASINSPIVRINNQ